MKPQPDKFFHDKLHNYQKPLKPGAWDKVSQNLDERHRSYLWLKVAASLLLIASASILIFSPEFGAPALLSNRHAGKDAQEEKTTPKTFSEDLADEREDPVQNDAPEMSVNETTTPPAAKEEPKRKEGKTPRPSTTPTTVKTPAEDIIADFGNTVAVQPVQPELNPTEPSPDPLSAHENRNNTTIVFSAQEVNEKYFTKTATAQATPDDDGTSTLKKLLDKAYDLKYNQDPIGDLRKRKNELFALNFRSEKQRKN